MTTTIKPQHKTTYHRDGSVSLWDVYQQQWVRTQAEAVSDEVLASLTKPERDRILRLRGGVDLE